MANEAKLEWILALIPEESKEACITELRACESKQQRAEVLEKYGVDVQAQKENYSEELDDAALDDAAAGKWCFCYGC